MSWLRVWQGYGLHGLMVYKSFVHQHCWAPTLCCYLTFSSVGWADHFLENRLPPQTFLQVPLYFSLGCGNGRRGSLWEKGKLILPRLVWCLVPWSSNNKNCVYGVLFGIVLRTLQVSTYLKFITTPWSNEYYYLSFYTWGNSGTDDLSDLFMTTQLVSGRAEIEIQILEHNS